MKFKGGYNSVYSSQFKSKEFDSNILSFVADKVDHLWQNIPTDYRTTNDFFFKEKPN